MNVEITKILNTTDEYTEKLKSFLLTKPVTVVFNKVDGSERIMECTMSPDLIPSLNVEQTASTKKRTESEGTLRVWDIEKQGWRSFRTDSVVSYSISLK